MLAGYVLDEQLRGSLWQAIQSHNARGIDPIDATRVGDPPDARGLSRTNDKRE